MRPSSAGRFSGGRFNAGWFSAGRFNAGWRFGPASDGCDLPGFDDSGFAEVTLPHTVTPLSWQDWDPAAGQRVWAYRKHFDAPSGSAGMRVFLDVGGGHDPCRRDAQRGPGGRPPGRLPAVQRRAHRRAAAAGNVLAARLDSSFNLNVPPDRPAPEPSTSVDYSVISCGRRRWRRARYGACVPQAP